MAATIESNDKKTSWLSSLIQWIRNFISSRREDFASRAASPTLSGINLMPDDYTPAKLTEHPGVGSHEEIEPMK
jgi:hypothetical protein